MNLAFTQKINDKPTLFPAKIWRSITEFKLMDDIELKPHETPEYWTKELNERGIETRFTECIHSKAHTIRRDPKARWKEGMKIHPIINNRSPQRFQFAPLLKCYATQSFLIEWFKPVDPTNPSGSEFRIYIDFELKIIGNFFSIPFKKEVDEYKIVKGDPEMFTKLCRYDGFDSEVDFLNYFSEDFKGVLIHWTPTLRY